MRHQRCGRCPTSGRGRQLVTAGIKIGPMTIQHHPTPQHLPSGASKDPHGHSLAPDIQGKSHARGDSATAAGSRQEMAAHNHLEGHSEVSYHQTECLTPYEPQENNTCNTDTASQAILSSKPPNSPNHTKTKIPLQIMPTELAIFRFRPTQQFSKTLENNTHLHADLPDIFI